MPVQGIEAVYHETGLKFKTMSVEYHYGRISDVADWFEERRTANKDPTYVQNAWNHIAMKSRRGSIRDLNVYVVPHTSYQIASAPWISKEGHPHMVHRCYMQHLLPLSS